MAAGVASEVAHEIVGALEGHWSLMARLSGDQEVMHSRVKAASDILFGSVPDLADLIRAKETEVVASPRQSPGRQAAVTFTVHPEGDRIDVHVRGMHWDVVLRLRQRDNRPDAGLWMEMRRNLLEAKLRKGKEAG